MEEIRKIYFMIEPIDEEYGDRFKKKFKKEFDEWGMKTKLINYKKSYGDFILSSENIRRDLAILIKTDEFPKKMEKYLGGIILPESIEEFRELCSKGRTLIEIDIYEDIEKPDSSQTLEGVIIAKEKNGRKKYFLKGAEILNCLRVAIKKRCSLYELFKE